MTSTSPRIRILHVIDSLGIGGTEAGLATLIERSRDRFTHSVCCIRGDGLIADRLRAGGTDVQVIGKAEGNDWSLPFRLARHFRTARPHIVHTRNWGSIDGILGARLARVPIVIHGEHGREVSDVHGANRKRNTARRVLAGFTDQVVTVSEQLRTWLVGDVGLRGDKVTLVRNGVDSTRFRRLADRERLRTALGYTPDDLVFGTVGRLDPVKDQLAIVEVATILAASHPRIKALIVGDGPMQATMAEAIAQSGQHQRVRLLGHRNDVPELMNVMDIFVLPSLGEGLCNTILEAMAVGLPVVATAVGGNAEMVVDGKTGTLVASANRAALAAALTRYAGDPALRAAQGEAGMRRVRACFSIQSMVDGYDGLYRKALGAKAARVAAVNAHATFPLSTGNVELPPLKKSD